MNCRSILIVEDDKWVREVLSLALQIEGYDVETAVNGKDGLEVLERMEQPCLVLLDLMMPVMNGWKFAEAVKANALFAQIPIIVFSAYPDKAKTIKSNAFLKKPVDMNHLFKVVKENCEKII